MIKHFFNLEWKQFFRSSYWQKSIATNLVLVFFALYMLASFMFLGIALYKVLEKYFPDASPLHVFNSMLGFWFLFELIFRYFMQSLPVMNIKPLLNLPIKKSKVAHYTLQKSAISFFNILPMVLIIPFGMMLVKNGQPISGIVAWEFSILCLTLFLNYTNFIINKKNSAFVILVIALSLLIALKQFQIFDISPIIGNAFDAIVEQPFLAVIPLAAMLGAYFINFKELIANLYLDQAVSKKIKEANTRDLSWANRFGDVAPFIKNDIRLIWRNKRPKMVFLMSFLFLFYGLIFFRNSKIIEAMPSMLIFVSIFITGMFTMNFGQYIPAWDSAYYPMLMSQNIRYRKFLDSKWYLTTIMTLVLLVLSIPYVYFGWNILLLIFVGAIFNIGFNSLFVLFAGAFNRKRIDLERSAFANYQGTSATQFLMIIPIIGVPMLLYAVFNKFFGFNAGVIAIAAVGIFGILFRNFFMNKIEQLYINNKYKTINAFSQKA